MARRQLLALFLTGVFALTAILVVALAARDSGATPSSELAPGVEASESPFAGAISPEGLRAPDFTLRDEEGDVVRMRDYRGTPVVVTFLYASCEESCPAQAQQIKGALDRLGEDVPVLAISVDPPRDTPAKARSFLVEQGMVGRMRWALGDRSELRQVWKDWAIQPQLEDLEHQARIQLVDARGYQRVGFPLSQATPERIAHDLALLMNES